MDRTNQKGIIFIPLFFLVPLFIVGAYFGARFLTTSRAKPDPALRGTPTTKAEGTPQVGPFIYKSEPSFSFLAPSDWLNRTSANEIAAFGAPEEDIERVDEKQMYSVQAVITIRATDSYQNLEDFASEVKASGGRLKDYQLINFTGRSLETKYKSSKDGRIKHELDYFFFKDGVSFLVSGIALDSAWDKRGGEIRSALDSFKFK